MSKKKTENVAPVETEAHEEEQQSSGNYFFAVKVLAILAAIIILIVVLRALGVPIAIKDWLSSFTAAQPAIFPFVLPQNL